MISAEWTRFQINTSRCENYLYISSAVVVRDGGIVPKRCIGSSQRYTCSTSQHDVYLGARNCQRKLFGRHAAGEVIKRGCIMVTDRSRCTMQGYRVICIRRFSRSRVFDCTLYVVLNVCLFFMKYCTLRRAIAEYSRTSLYVLFLLSSSVYSFQKGIGIKVARSLFKYVPFYIRM